MSHEDCPDGGSRTHRGIILTDTSGQARALDKHDGATHTAGSDRGNSGRLPPILVTDNPSTPVTPNSGSRKGKHNNEGKRVSFRTRARSRLSEQTGSEEGSVRLPGIGSPRSPSSKKRRRRGRGRARSRQSDGEGSGAPSDSEQDLSDYPDSGDELQQIQQQKPLSKHGDMNDKNQNVIRFVYSEAVRQALKNHYAFAHPLFTLPSPGTAGPEEEQKINFEIVRLPEIYEDINDLLATYSVGSRRESKTGITVTDSHSSLGTRRSVDSKGNKSKLGDIGKRQSGKSISSDNSKSDKSNIRKKKHGVSNKTVHFPSLNNGAAVSSGS